MPDEKTTVWVSKITRQMIGHYGSSGETLDTAIQKMANLAESMKTERWKAAAIAVDKTSVRVLCPFCGEVHTHGNDLGIHEVEYGSRLSHCQDRRGEYHIFTTDRTIRSNETSKKQNKSLLKQYRGRVY